MKRFIPIFLCLCLCISVFVFSVSAEDTIVDGRTVLNYMDYVKGYDLTIPNNGWAYLVLSDDFFVSNKEDVNGYAENKGSFPWYLHLKNEPNTYSANVVSAVPGGSVNNVFLDLSNIPSGSRLWMQALGEVVSGVSSFQTEILVSINSGITYYDANFNKISDAWSEQKFYSFQSEERFTQIVELTIEPPVGAKYCTFYTRCNFGIGQSNDQTDYFRINFQYSAPNLMISTSYTQLIIQSIINSKKPVGSSGIVDVDDLEEYLKDSTSDGRTEADEVMNEAPNLLVSHLSGFLFMTTVIEVLYSAGWIRGILTVSLALGIFGFITNLITSVGRAVEHRGKGAGKS